MVYVGKHLLLGVPAYFQGLLLLVSGSISKLVEGCYLWVTWLRWRYPKPVQTKSDKKLSQWFLTPYILTQFLAKSYLYPLLREEVNIIITPKSSHVERKGNSNHQAIFLKWNWTESRCYYFMLTKLDTKTHHHHCRYLEAVAVWSQRPSLPRLKTSSLGKTRCWWGKLGWRVQVLDNRNIGSNLKFIQHIHVVKRV